MIDQILTHLDEFMLTYGIIVVAILFVVAVVVELTPNKKDDAIFKVIVEKLIEYRKYIQLFKTKPFFQKYLGFLKKPPQK